MANKESMISHKEAASVILQPKWQSISVSNIPMKSVDSILESETKKINKKKSSENFLNKTALTLTAKKSNLINAK